MLLCGALAPFAFSPFGYYPVAVIATAILFWSWLGVSAKRASLRGWLFGFGFFTSGVHWVYISMYEFGHVPPLISAALTALFAAILAMYPALAGLIGRVGSLKNKFLNLIVIYPASWILLEWVRSWMFTGFPWLNMGYSHTDSLLAAWSPLLGVYGVGWISMVGAGLLLASVIFIRKQRYLALAGLVALMLMSVLLSQISWTRPLGDAFTVSLIQGNIPQAQKWHPRYRQKIFDRYEQLTQEHLGSDLIVWPEAAMPSFFHEIEPQYFDRLRANLEENNSELLMGVLKYEPQSNAYYNSVYSLGAQPGFYHKRHLVPFGEYIPLESVVGKVLDLLQVPLSPFDRGSRRQQPLQAAGHVIGASVCYEIAFGEEILLFLPQAEFLVTVSNNAWFGRSNAADQLQQMARMRARESGRYVLSATNDGITAIVDERGRTVSSAPRYKALGLTGTVQPRQGTTPYVFFGNYPVIGFLTLILMLAWWHNYKQRLKDT